MTATTEQLLQFGNNGCQEGADAALAGSGSFKLPN